METVSPSVPVDQAWLPLPAAAWDAAAARHLLRRLGFSAPAERVAEALRDSPGAWVARAFAPAEPLEAPLAVRRMAEEAPEVMRRMRGATEEERRMLRNQERERARLAYEDLGIRWLRRAADPAHSAREKFVLFLQDVFVVAFDKVRNPALLHAHQELLRARGTGPYPDLCKAVTRSPAMIVYLDLQQSRAGHPNENFARELFELFTLGEGNYSEEDIREAARAFTGYRQAAGRYVFAARQHDRGRKRVFGRTGPFSGDDVIDLVFRQPAAARFLPAELARFYLCETPLPPEYVEALGEAWRQDGFHTGRLLERFFASRLFFDPAFRGEMIKSPVHFYLGLLQDLGLDVAPFPRITLGSLRQMGQPFFSPPNVRGWVGGRHWINASTLAARRQLVESLFTPLDEARLNGDEIVELVAARAEGKARLWVEDPASWLGSLPADPGSADRLVGELLAADPGPEVKSLLARGLAAARAAAAPAGRLRQLATLLLQSPHYQLS